MRILQTVAIFILLTGCVQTKIVPVMQNPPPLNCGQEPHYPEPMMLKVAPNQCIDPEGMQWVAISPKHYENLATNLQATLASQKAKNVIILFYRDCIKRHNESVKSLTVSVEPPAS